MTLTQARLQQLLDYNPDTGIFTWKVSTNRRIKVGSEAGSVNKVSGYIIISVDGKGHLAHRLAWLHFYGIWPIGEIDHVDGCKTDNRIAYLKDGTKRGNQSNQLRHRAGHLVGTYFHKASGTWHARININSKQKYLSFHLTQLEAHIAYMDYRALHNLN